MNRKSRSVVVLVTFVVLVVAAWAGSGALWKMFLAMHGIHH